MASWGIGKHEGQAGPAACTACMLMPILTSTAMHIESRLTMYRMHTLMLLRSVTSVLGPSGTWQSGSRGRGVPSVTADVKVATRQPCQAGAASQPARAAGLGGGTALSHPFCDHIHAQQTQQHSTQQHSTQTHHQQRLRIGLHVVALAVNLVGRLHVLVKHLCRPGQGQNRTAALGGDGDDRTQV